MSTKVPTLMIPGAEPMHRVLDQAARMYLTHLIRECNGNMTHVARIAGVHRRSVYKLVVRYGLDYQGQRLSK